MAAGDQAVAEGLAKVAHAIRRSTALTVAMQMTEPGSSVDDVLDLATDLAKWIGGKSLEAEVEQEGAQPSVGVPWSDRDQA